MLLISVAYAHPSAVTHDHAADPAALWIIGFWLVAALVYVAASQRWFLSARIPAPARHPDRTPR